jgi:drug/metabolite transporter (DMT)-like permease
MVKDGNSSWPGLGAGAAFGTFGVLAMWARATGMSVPQVLAWRFLLAMVCLLPLLLLGPSRPRPTRRELGLALLLGATLYTVQAFTFLGAITRLGAGLAALLLYIYPALVALAQRVLGGKPLGKGGKLSLLLTFAGTALVGLSGGLNLDAWGLLLGFGTAVIYALYLVLSERYLSHLDPMSTALTLFVPASLVSVVLVAVRGEALLPPVAALSSLLGLAVLATVLPVLLLFRSMQSLGAARTALLCTVEPVVALLLGAALLAERPSPMQWAGGALVVVGVARLQWLRHT